MGILLSLVSALAYGVSDFLGGLISKRASPWQVAVLAQSVSVVLMTVVALVVGGQLTGRDAVVAVVAGAGNGFGAVFLYRGLAGARMSVVAPISAIGTALIPVAAGLLLGDRPGLLAALGIGVAFPAVALISRTTAVEYAQRSGVADGMLAGLGFGTLFTALAQIDDAAGMSHFPVLYASSLLLVIAAASWLRQPWRPTRAAGPALLMSVLSVLAATTFYLATRHGLLSIVAVIAALYPAATVVLAAAVLRERIAPWQALGLALALAAVVLVALG